MGHVRQGLQVGGDHPGVLATSLLYFEPDGKVSQHLPETACAD
jgi:hypothetical protein